MNNSNQIIENKNQNNIDDESFDLIFEDIPKNNSTYNLYFGKNCTNNKSYIIINEIQTRDNQLNSVLIGYDVCFFYKNGNYSIYLKDEFGNPLSNQQIILM